MPKHRARPAPAKKQTLELNNRIISKQEFANRVYEAMLKKGWTQSQVARYANLNRDQISTYVRGKSLPSPQNLIKLSSALQVRPEELLPNYMADADDSTLTKLQLKEIHGDDKQMFLTVNMKVNKKTALKIFTLLQDEND
jgi:transcriptional regulator with XRE-family HTH domain